MLVANYGMLIANFGSGKSDQNAGQIEQIWPGAQVMTIDSDPANQADIRDDLRSLNVSDNTFNGGLCSHVLEHFCESDASVVLSEMRRVLKVGAKLVIVVPDLLQTCRLVAQGRLMFTAYESPAGPIRPIDVLFGLQSEVKEHPLMAHRFGFDAMSLIEALRRAGFEAKVNTGTLHLIGEGIKVDNRASNAGGDFGREDHLRSDSSRGIGSVPVHRLATIWRPGMPVDSERPGAVPRLRR